MPSGVGLQPDPTPFFYLKTTGYNHLHLKGGKFISLTVLALMGLASFAAPAAEINGKITLGAGLLEHPLGVENEPGASYLSQELNLAYDIGPKDGFFRLGYEGDASQFGNNTSLGSTSHGLGLEWFHNSNSRINNLSAGLQGSIRKYKDYYTIYDYRNVFAYFALKKYLGQKTLLRGYAALRVRSYSDLPEESYTEPHGRLEVQHYLESRTTLGLAVKMGAKIFYDPVALRVWDTSNTPSVSQLAIRFNFAQGLTDRIGIRGHYESRWNLSDFPRYVADDVYDSPLLDSYAHDGHDIFLALKWLGPAQTWINLTAAMGKHDFGSLLFSAGDSGNTRLDDVIELGISLERSLSSNLGKPKLKLSGGWRDQDSSLTNYTYTGPHVATSLSWLW